MKKIRAAVVAGGSSNEREISLKTGTQVFEGLKRLEKKYDVSFLEVTKTDTWEWRNAPEKKSKKIWSGEFPEKKVFQKNADIFFIALHGAFGEDGRAQALFEWLGMPYTGSGVLSSAMGMDKYRCSEFLSHCGMVVPRTVKLSSKNESAAKKEMKKNGINIPCVVKPNDARSSVGITLVKKWSQFSKALGDAFCEGEEVVIQQYVKGRELSCGVLGNTEEEIQPLPPVEIVVHNAEFFDYQAKYFSKQTEEICPAPLSKKETKAVEQYALLAHQALGCAGLTRSDFILSEADGKVYFLEINTLPGMTAASICPKEVRAMGMSFEEFIDKIVQLGLASKR